MIILAADVGGTKTVLGLYTYTNHSLILQASERYDSKRFNSFSDVLQSFLGAVKTPVNIAVFACAGPVQDNTVKFTNLPWKISARAVEKRFNIDRVELINDLQGIAYAVPECAKLLALTKNKPDLGNKVVLAPGTGLGMATLVRCGQEWHAVPSEGGHADFAPVDELQTRLLIHLVRKGQVDIESVLSGKGILNVYNFLKSMELKEMLRKPTAEDISAAALAKKDALSMKTMEVFTSVLARTASNLALNSFATGGVYIAGGIVPKIIPLLGKFMQQFKQNRVMRGFLGKIPVFVIMDHDIAVFGAARYACTLI